MKRLGLAIAAMLSCLAPGAFAQAASSYVSKATWETLIKNGSAFASSFEYGKAPQLLPAHPFAPTIRRKIAADGANVTVELLFAFPRARPADVEAERLALYNLMRSVSTLQGIEYWSASRNSMRTLYARSFRIDNANSRNRLADPLVSVVPEKDSFLVLQEDLTFGTNVYEMSYESDRSGILMETVNLTGLWYGIIQAVGERSFHVRTLVIPCDEHVLVYIASTANASILPGVQGKIEDSFGNRARAIYAWFVKGAKAIYARM